MTIYFVPCAYICTVYLLVKHKIYNLIMTRVTEVRRTNWHHRAIKFFCDGVTVVIFEISYLSSLTAVLFNIAWSCNSSAARANYYTKSAKNGQRLF